MVVTVTAAAGIPAELLTAEKLVDVAIQSRQACLVGKTPAACPSLRCVAADVHNVGITSYFRQFMDHNGRVLQYSPSTA